MAKLIDLDETETSYFDEIRTGGLDDDSDDNEEQEVTEDVEGGSDIELPALPVEHHVKIVVLGDLGVGKTALLESYTEADLSSDNFDKSTDYRVSVDVMHHLKKLDLGDNKKSTVQLWDIPGKFWQKQYNTR